MENDRDHSTIDWILQLDSSVPTAQQEQSIITNQSPQQMVSSVPTPSRSNNMTKSDLFEFFLGEEIGLVMDDNNDISKQQQQQQTKRSAQLEDDDDKQSTFTAQKRTKKTSSVGGAKPLSGRLDFRPTMTDQVPESQLKSMSPRERRQLRNKISARNFRNRRKEYMSTLEEELDDCKTENSRLHSELSSMREKMTQLEDENKQLRLDLVLYEQGINPVTKSSAAVAPSSDYLQLYQDNTPLPLPTTTDSTTGTLSSFELSPGTVHALSSDSSASPPDLINEQSNLYPANNITVMDTFQRYPLLAPALMSIVVGHTMTLSTNDLLTLNHPTNTTTIPTSTDYSGFNDKRTLKIWELLQPFATLHRKSITGTEEEDQQQMDDDVDNGIKDDEIVSSTPQDSYHEEKCMGATVVAVFHRYLKSYICASVHNYIEYCCRQGSQGQQQASTTEEEEQQKPQDDEKVDNDDEDDHDNSSNYESTLHRKSFTPFCKHIRRAKELFIPVA
ncbi:hypothetical protein BCR42DRAFT_497326 [Absidia repens]|uniref:BZIP domain-containing protein n=1 Tax=Absidia repens TaxID=90262 RepID=A0A1X2HLQ1_9FUNG|nr:hypothetical protein BCR42DRAFT_497326 [Absidia repens]